MKNTWQLQDAKARFSEVVNQALSEGAQFVTRRGKQTIVILSVSEYEQLTQKEQTLSAYLKSSPLANSDISITRDKDFPRDFNFES